MNLEIENHYQMHEFLQAKSIPLSILITYITEHDHIVLTHILGDGITKDSSVILRYPVHEKEFDRAIVFLTHSN